MLGQTVKNLSRYLSRWRESAIYGLLLAVLLLNPAFAQNVSTVAIAAVDSVAKLPGLVSAIAYMLGLLFGVRGILKLKSHVENPGEGSGQTPLRTPIISFFAGGALFALPIIYSAAATTINGGADGTSVFSIAAIVGTLSGLFGGGEGVSGDLNFNFILNNIILSLASLPGLIAAITYLLGIVIVVMGVIKVKEHVETPEQTKMQEGVIRLVAGGALLAMPTIYNAMFNTIDGTGGVLTALTSLFGGTGFFTSNYIDGACSAVEGGGGSFGQRICSVITHTGAFPAFLTAISYLFGLVMGVWGVLKIRDHVLNPQQTGIFEGVSRFVAGGAFFALPLVIQVFTNTISGGALFTAAAVGGAGYNHGGGALEGIANGIAGGGACPAGLGLGLDGMLVCFATDLLAPVHALLNFFAFVAGIIFIMIGVSRLIKGAQEGAKAPGGLGTLMTFAIGGALISYNDLMRAASQTFTGSATTAVYAEMQYTEGMTDDEQAALHAVISSVIKFMIVIGIISFVRGLFIVRNVAEGNQQASMMAGVTHIVGGALAVNLGPVINAVQATLGTTDYGIVFSL